MIAIRLCPVLLLALASVPTLAADARERGFIRKGMREGHQDDWGQGADRRHAEGVVIGSNNSAHDICAALWENVADVTMVQRTTTHIAKSDSLMDLALGGLYSEDAVKKASTTTRPT